MSSICFVAPTSGRSTAWRACVVVAALSLSSVLEARPVYAQPSIVFTGDFSNAADVTEWTFRPDPGGAIQGGGIQWSGAEGQPPGSLELVNPGGGSNTVRAFSICLPFGGDQPWTASVDVMPFDPVICDIDLVSHATTDCSDDVVGSSQGPGHEVQGVWTTLDRERALLAEPPADTTRAIRLQLATGNVNQAPGSCLFDNIVITGSTAPAAVVAHGGVSLVLLVGLVVGVGFWLLRLR